MTRVEVVVVGGEESVVGLLAIAVVDAAELLEGEIVSPGRSARCRPMESCAMQTTQAVGHHHPHY